MNIALILSGGAGSRISSHVPKQYISIGGKMVITRCLERVMAHPMIDAVQIVAAAEWREEILSPLPAQDKIRGFSSPGQNRQLSIYHGLKDISAYADETDTVLVHDAARPCVSAGLITRCLKDIAGHEGVMPVLPMKDTVYYSGDGKRVERLLERERIFAGQAPEAFLAGPYLRANERLMPEAILRIKGSTEPAILAGMDVVMIPGEESNFKITTNEDLARYREMVK